VIFGREQKKKSATQRLAYYKPSRRRYAMGADSHRTKRWPSQSRVQATVLYSSSPLQLLVRFTGLRDYLTAKAWRFLSRRRALGAGGLYSRLRRGRLSLRAGIDSHRARGGHSGLLGFVYVWIGAMIGASAAFHREDPRPGICCSLIGDRLRKYDDAIERNGFAAVLYLRLVYFPFTPMNFGMGLTKVHFRDYFFGTALGILVGTFIFTFFIGTLKEVWVSGNWAELLSFKVVFSVALFVFSFFIPNS
jgi:hypothetical protein